MDPFVSIIIPVKNGQKTIKKCLDSIKNLNYTHYEVTVIDDGSTDKTGDILSSYSDIQIIRTSGLGPSYCRNLGIKQSRGEYLAFTDADCLVHPEWLRELLRGFKQDNVAAVGGNQESPIDESDFGRMVQGFLKTVGFVAGYVKTKKTIMETKHNPSCNVMYRKEICLQAGGFLEGLWPGEDVDLDYRIRELKKYKLIYNPEAIVYHYRPDNLAAFGRMMKNYGWAQGILVRRYGAFRLIHYEPAFLVILSLALLAISVHNLNLGLLCLVIPLFYLFLRAGTIKGTGTFGRLLTVAIFYWNLGFMKGLIKCERG